MARCWGCPAYVLDPTLQDGKKLPQWNLRSRLGQFLGWSDKHSSTVGLIRNCKTDAITTQFHVVYDDHFSATSSDLNHDNIPIPDCEGFIKAMNLEIEQLNNMEAVVTVPCQKAIDEGCQVIECTWAFKRKCYPDGTVKKLKARLCIRGDLQELGVDVFDTYSPVVQCNAMQCNAMQ